MHLHDQAAGFVTSTGVVGSGLPIAVRLGLATQLDGGGRAVVTTFGDSATSIGAFHEAMNLAALWKLPVVLVCRNNQWAEQTPTAECTAPHAPISRRARHRARGPQRHPGSGPG
jgi:pyruvate dehydrogenase E1 component alpha subunit